MPVLARPVCVCMCVRGSSLTQVVALLNIVRLPFERVWKGT